MRKITFLIFLLIGFVSCQKDYKYRVYNPNIHKPKGAIFYTDTLEILGDSLGYHNSDSSYVLISDSLCLDCKIDTLY